MSFEIKSLWVIVQMDPMEGACYTELAHDYEESNDELDDLGINYKFCNKSS